MRDNTRPYHHGNLREALIAAGLAVARAQGPDALAVRGLAAEVGVTPNAVYRHFADLEHLRAAMGQWAREELAGRLAIAASSDIDGASDADRARERLVRMSRTYVAFAREEPNLFATALRPNAIPPDRPDDPDGWTVGTGVLEEMVAAGAMSAELREVAPWFIWSIWHGLASLVVSTELPVGLEVEVERIVTGVTDRMLKGLG